MIGKILLVATFISLLFIALTDPFGDKYAELEDCRYHCIVDDHTYPKINNYTDCVCMSNLSYSEWRSKE